MELRVVAVSGEPVATLLLDSLDGKKGLGEAVKEELQDRRSQLNLFLMLRKLK